MCVCVCVFFFFLAPTQRPVSGRGRPKVSTTKPQRVSAYCCLITSNLGPHSGRKSSPEQVLLYTTLSTQTRIHLLTKHGSGELFVWDFLLFIAVGKKVVGHTTPNPVLKRLFLPCCCFCPLSLPQKFIRIPYFIHWLTHGVLTNFPPSLPPYRHEIGWL